MVCGCWCGHLIGAEVKLTEDTNRPPLMPYMGAEGVRIGHAVSLTPRWNPRVYRHVVRKIYRRKPAIGFHKRRAADCMALTRQVLSIRKMEVWGVTAGVTGATPTQPEEVCRDLPRSWPKY